MRLKRAEIATHEASQLTGYSESHLRRLARLGWVKARKREGRWYFDWEVLRAYKDGCIGTRQASQLTGLSGGHLRRLARKGFVRAHKREGRWCFDWEGLRAYRDGWIGTRQASRRTGYSESHLRSLARKDQVRAHRKGKGKRWLFNWMNLQGAIAGALDGDAIIPPRPPKPKPKKNKECSGDI